jgi:outer membrane protein
MKTILKLTLAAAAMLLIGGTNNASAQKFGYIDVQELVFLMPEMETVRTNFDAVQVDLQGQHETMVVEFNKKQDEYQRTVSTMTDGTRKIKEDELQSLAQRIQTFEQSIQEDLAAQQNKLLEPLFTKAQEAIDSVAAANGFTAVFAAAALIYSDKATMVDIMPLVKTHLGIVE